MPEGDEIAAATDMLQRMWTIGTRSVEMALARAMAKGAETGHTPRSAATGTRSPSTPAGEK